MRTLDLSPLYRNSIGYDQFASLLDSAFRSDRATPSYPPYDIEMLDENSYIVTLAVAGFNNADLDIQVDRGVLTVRGDKSADSSQKNYLHKGIANRAFERKFNLAEHVEVAAATLDNGLLTINLKREIPDAMKPRRIEIATTDLKQ